MVPPPKKPMPEKLRDALNKQRGPYAPEPAALAYAKPEDPHSAERKMLEQILNGCADVPSFDASPRPDPQASNDLVAQMAGRLGKLEASLRHLRDEAAAKDEALAGLRGEVARLRARDGDEDELYEENDALRARLREMEKFLSDYGLVWVGGDATRPKRDETPADEPPRSPTRPAAPRVDTARLVEALRVLNARVLGDRPQVHVEGTRARFKLKDGERVAVYADGLLINGGPFRPYGSPTCRAFVDDVLDGYFPAEFKDRYPDGVPFDVKDVASEQYASYGEAFGGAGRATGRRVRTLADVGDRDIAPVAPEALLAKLPASTVNADGRVVDVREAVRRRLAGDPAAPPVAFASDADDRIATLQVRTHTGTKFVVKLGYDACVGDLRSEIDARLGAAAPAYDVRTAFPARAYGDDAATLESAGLVPTAVILVQKRSP